LFLTLAFDRGPPLVNIRIATAADIPAILALERQCVLAAHWTELQYQDLFEKHPVEKERPEEPSQRLVLAIEEISEAASPLRSCEPSLLGFVIAHRVGREWELENIAVAPSIRRRGLATRLVREMFHRASDASGEAVFLEVRESNQPARAFYEKLAFRQSGRRKGYYQNPVEDAVLYRRALP
jgi:ribosomal-protein-alanine acetyltransferase